MTVMRSQEGEPLRWKMISPRSPETMKTAKPNFKLRSEADVCSVRATLLLRAWSRASSTCAAWELGGDADSQRAPRAGGDRTYAIPR